MERETGLKHYKEVGEVTVGFTEGVKVKWQRNTGLLAKLKTILVRRRGLPTTCDVQIGDSVLDVAINERLVMNIGGKDRQIYP
jgi:hypothetical protein